MFKMLDKYDRSSDAGRQGFYFLIFFLTDVWCCMDVIANIFDFNVIVFSMLIGWSPRKKWFRISSKEWTSLGGPQGYYHKISCFFYIRVHKILYVGDKCMYTYTYIYIYSTNTHYHLQVSDLPLRGLCIFRQPDNLGVRCFGDGYNIVITMVLNPHKLGYNPYDYDYIYICMLNKSLSIHL